MFTEDHGVLQALDGFYRAHDRRGLFAVETLFEAAHAAGLRTATIGKIGPAFLQDLRPDDALSVVLDENVALPFGFAQKLQAAHFALPANAARYPFSSGQALVLAADNGKPTASIAERQVRLADGATPDPRASAGSAHNAANGYLMGAYLEYVLPSSSPISRSFGCAIRTRPNINSVRARPITWTRCATKIFCSADCRASSQSSGWQRPAI